MPSYQVIVTRDVTESAVILIHAKDTIEAETLALRAAKEGTAKFEQDDDNTNSRSAEPYVTNIEEEA